MIHCPNCDIQFTARYPRCPYCGDYETPWKERRRYLRKDATDRLHDGGHPPLIRASLIESGFSDAEADEVLHLAGVSLRRENRRHGVYRLAVGAVMLVFGLFALGNVIMTFQPDSGVRLGGRALGLLLIGGFALSGLGLLACLSGVWAMLTGKD
jgi:hypothetical protein